MREREVAGSRGKTVFILKEEGFTALKKRVLGIHHDQGKHQQNLSGKV